MKPLVTVALLGFLVAIPIHAACPVARPDANQFHMTASRACTAAQPCLTTQTLTFQLVKNASCYPSWISCPGYEIQACDRVTWDFGDGSAPVTVIGSSTIAHRFAPGRHQVRATVTNAKGSAYVLHDLHVGMTPAAYVSFARESYTYGEGDGTAVVTIVRRGEMARRVPLVLETSDLPLVMTRQEIVFEPGESTKSVAIPIRNDDVRHAWFPAWVWLYQSGGEAILKHGFVESTQVTILDDDPPVVVTPLLAQRTIVEGDDITPVRIGIRLSRAQSQPVRMIVTVWDVMSTARWQTDWLAEWTEIEIPAGQTEGHYDIRIVGDAIAEGRETVVIYAGPTTNPHDLTPEFSGWPLTITIEDDDAPPPPPPPPPPPTPPSPPPGELMMTVPATVRLSATESGTLAADVPAGARATLKASRRGIVSIPSSVPFDAHGRATFTIIGAKTGTVDITASARTKSGQIVRSTAKVTVTRR